MAQRTLNIQSRRTAPKAGRRHQRGDALIDAMLASLITLLLGMGPLYVMTKVAVMQREGSAQQLVSAQLRTLLQTIPKSDICNTDGTPTSWSPQTIPLHAQSASGSTQQVAMTVRALCRSENITVNGVSIPQVQLTLIGCLPVTLGLSGPVVLREGSPQNDEPTTCPTST